MDAQAGVRLCNLHATKSGFPVSSTFFADGLEDFGTYHICKTLWKLDILALSTTALFYIDSK